VPQQCQKPRAPARSRRAIGHVEVYGPDHEESVAEPDDAGGRHRPVNVLNDSEATRTAGSDQSVVLSASCPSSAAVILANPAPAVPSGSSRAHGHIGAARRENHISASVPFTSQAHNAAKCRTRR
jgi:hypothetical protein